MEIHLSLASPALFMWACALFGVVVAIPIALALQLLPTAISLGKSLFGGKSPQEKAQERLEKIAEKGLDPALLQRALATLNARNQAEQGGVLSRLAAGGIDPSSGLAQEAVGATRRGLGARTGEAQSLFNTQSEEAKMRANQQLLGLPVDQSTGDLLGSGLQAVQAYLARPKAPGAAQPAVPTARSIMDLETAPRGGLTPSQPALNPARGYSSPSSAFQPRGSSVDRYLPRKLLNPYAGYRTSR